ncbi:25026_t:CDS:1, partial [Racocetra persica]
MFYQIGICYGCQKCLYCGTTENCECDKTTKPTKNNRTEEVKTAYCRFYKSTLTNEQKEFLKDRKSLF